MQDRCDAINALIKKISEEERAFFLNKEGNGMIANFQLREGRIFYQDEWKGICREIKSTTDTAKLNEWVSHGHSLRSQIIEFAKFIRTGEKGSMLSRYWGVSFESQYHIHKKAKEVGYYDQIGFVFHDYGQDKDRYLCGKCDEVEAEYKEENKHHRQLCRKCNESETEVSGAKALRTPPTTEVVGIRAGDILS